MTADCSLTYNVFLSYRTNATITVTLFNVSRALLENGRDIKYSRCSLRRSHSVHYNKLTT